jgi:HlyD family secretion protein
MSRRRALPLVLLLTAAVIGVVWLRRGDGALHYTGFVEGEQRVLRAEVSGRVLEVGFGEGDAVPAGAIVARLDPSEIDARIASKQRELGVLEAQIRRQEEQVALTEATWTQDVAAQEATLRQAEADALLARRSYERTEKLRADGVTSPQRLDEARAARDATRSAVERARELLLRSRAQAGEIELARRQREVLGEQLALTRAQLDELAVLRARHDVRAPAADTVVQSQLLWPGELAQPGTPVLSVLDPRDKYVQIYVPVADVQRVRVGARVEIELDSAPGRRVPGEVSFVAGEANFTPEKIETRSDRLGQVYRAKVRILADVERFQPGTEGNVYLVGDAAADDAARRAARAEEP